MSSDDFDMAMAQILDEAEEDKFDRSEIEIVYSGSVTETLGRAFSTVSNLFYREHGYQPTVDQIELAYNFDDGLCWVELSVERETDGN